MDKITSKKLADIPSLTHGFYTRAGAPGNLVTVHQVHSPTAVIVEKPWPAEEQPKADALVTKNPDILIGVKTADCAPILLADAAAGVVAAAHAGWRGALDGVLEDTVQKMISLGAEASRIVAAIGPCIGPASYEVSAGFETPFLAQDPVNARFFTPSAKEGHLMFDLPGYVADRLARLGVRTVDNTARDTMAEEATFFSHRRATLRNAEKQEGRQMSVIGIKPPIG
jgi:YfiH family protein